MTMPNRKGYFGKFGGKFVPETLMAALDELEREYAHAKSDKRFSKALNYHLRNTREGPRRYILPKI